MLMGIFLLPFALYFTFVIVPAFISSLENTGHSDWITFLIFISICILFLSLSFIFFNKIRRRLLHLQSTMDIEKNEEELEYVEISGNDEVGNLEKSFNYMVEKLEESRELEQKEGQLRRDLIANLSHDLRTPLTSMRGQLSQIRKQADDGADEHLNTLDNNIDYMDRLIESLLSYTLLSADRYPYDAEQVELGAFLRQYIAEWYNVFEEEDFEVDADITKIPVTIETDSELLSRLLNNLVQNVLRHADDGKYIGFVLNDSEIIVEDRGPGFENACSRTKGAGIGLSIVELLTEKMKMDIKFHSDVSGTRVHLKLAPE